MSAMTVVSKPRFSKWGGMWRWGTRDLRCPARCPVCPKRPGMSNSELSGNLWVRDETGQILEIWQHRPGISSSLAHRSTPPPRPPSWLRHPAGDWQGDRNSSPALRVTSLGANVVFDQSLGIRESPPPPGGMGGLRCLLLPPLPSRGLALRQATPPPRAPRGSGIRPPPRAGSVAGVPGRAVIPDARPRDSVPAGALPRAGSPAEAGLCARTERPPHRGEARSPQRPRRARWGCGSERPPAGTRARTALRWVLRWWAPPALAGGAPVRQVWRWLRPGRELTDGCCRGRAGLGRAGRGAAAARDCAATAREAHLRRVPPTTWTAGTRLGARPRSADSLQDGSRCRFH